MIKIWFLACLLPICAFGQRVPARVTFHDELRPFFDLSLLPAFCTSTVQEEMTTYDRLGGNNDGFAGTWSFVRRNADSSLVMLDVEGPGVIDRFATPTPTEDTLDFYIDDMVRPVLSVCYRDLFSGKRYPFVSPLCGSAVGGYYCYFPILFQTRCRIVCRGKHLQFHQIGYRLFHKGTRAEAFSGQSVERAKGDLARIAELWQDMGKGKKGKRLERAVSIRPGGSAVVGNWGKGGRINGIELDTTGAKDCRLRVWWDGQDQPAVDWPLAILFGYGMRGPAMQSLLVGTRGDKHYLYFPMPFGKSARVELVNTGTAGTYYGGVTVWYSSKARDTETEGYFCAKATDRHLGKQDAYDTLLDITGKGHYVGTILIGQGEPGVDGTPFWEGDDSTVVDGSYLLHGTGTEDYFNGGWYDVKGRWDHAESLPLSGCLGYSKARSWSGGYRLLIGDKIPFRKSIYQGFEHGGTVHGAPAHYTSVVFYYADHPSGGSGP